MGAAVVRRKSCTVTATCPCGREQRFTLGARRIRHEWVCPSCRRIRVCMTPAVGPTPRTHHREPDRALTERQWRRIIERSEIEETGLRHDADPA